MKFITVSILIVFLSCSEKNDLVYTLVNNKRLGVDFVNQLQYTERLNPYTYRNFYNGGGVGVGDFNNDGLEDFYLVGNLVNNQLYINRGNWEFDEIAKKAGVDCKNIWSTGVSVVDVNGDGWLDIYVCKSGPPGGDNRSNELFINQKNLTFVEMARDYGLNDVGLSTHAAFFDMDKDGDLDCYLLNNSLRSVGNYDLNEDQRQDRDTLGGNKLLRNDDGYFNDISEAAGIYGSRIGFGLGVTIGDVNGDHWPDIYVSNDFFEKDYLYINNQDGSFAERIDEYISEMSLSSMGADMGDLNNDGYPEIFVTDMLPKEEYRLKTKTTFDSWDKYKLQLEKGYGRQFTRNALQLNNGDGTFNEISRFAGVHATDWSWGALLLDMNNDGLKDIFVANGLNKDLTDQDYINFIGSPDRIRELISNNAQAIKTLVDSIPSEAIPNVAFINQGELKFINEANSLGLGKPSFSNGSSYGDLDNDGDLDLIINNINEPVSIYRNNSSDVDVPPHYLKIRLEGRDKNTKALNAKVWVYSAEIVQFQELMPMRSYMSTTTYDLNFGLGDIVTVDSVRIVWPDLEEDMLYDIGIDTIYNFKRHHSEVNSTTSVSDNSSKHKLFESHILENLPDHIESVWSDFDREPMLLEMTSNEGPCLCSADVDKDGIDEFYIGGAKGYPGLLYHWENEKFVESEQVAFVQDRISEDTDCEFLDVNGDGFLDLYVASGGSELPRSSAALNDRLYLYDEGQYGRVKDIILPASIYESTGVIKTKDVDGDGDLDLFVGIRQRPFQYGVSTNAYLLENTEDANGPFNIMARFDSLGMITDAAWMDVEGDGIDEIIVVGEWMGVSILRITDSDWMLDHRLSNLKGLWKSIHAFDHEGDGDMDILLGNKGLNNTYQASVTAPLRLYINDFDNNGRIETVVSTEHDGEEYPIHLQPEFVKQFPSFKSRFLKHKAYAGKTISELFDFETLKQSELKEVNTLSSMLLVNQGKGEFKIEELPEVCQLSPIYAFMTDDFDKDGDQDVLYGGNQYKAKPFLGINTSNFCRILEQKDGRYFPMNSAESGIKNRGELRDVILMNSNQTKFVFLGKNDDQIEIYKY